MPSQKQAATPAKARRGRKANQPQLDHDGDGANGGSLPKTAGPAQAPAPPVGAAEPVGSEEVDLGAVTGRRTIVPVEAVLSALDDGFRSRLDRQRELPATLQLQARVLANEGRCAPIVFTEEDVPSQQDPNYQGAPSSFSKVALLDGADTLAAMMNLGRDSIPVIIIRLEDAGAAQSFLVHKRVESTEPENSEDDEMIRRVNATVDEASR